MVIGQYLVYLESILVNDVTCSPGIICCVMYSNRGLLSLSLFIMNQAFRFIFLWGDFSCQSLCFHDFLCWTISPVEDFSMLSQSLKCLTLVNFATMCRGTGLVNV